MKKKPTPLHLTPVSRIAIVVSVLLVIILVGYWDVARGGYLSTLFGASSEINAVSAKKACESGCGSDGLYHYWNKKKNKCVSEAKAKCKNNTQNTQTNGTDKDKNKVVKNAQYCKTYPKHIYKGCGKGDCKGSEMQVETRSDEDCLSYTTSCKSSFDCIGGNAGSCIGRKEDGTCESSVYECGKGARIEWTYTTADCLKKTGKCVPDPSCN